jgi:peptidyl-prolyl cis-trans isomerase C
MILVFSVAHAEPPTPVVRVGTAELSVTQLERELKSVPGFQLATFGNDPATIKQSYVENVTLRDLLLTQAGLQRKLDDSPRFLRHKMEALRRALADQLATQIRERREITNLAIEQYYTEHRRHFVTGKRILIWRILVDDKQVAQQILEAAKGTQGPERWTTLAREKSLDHATRMRRGTLGFVQHDGTTNIPEVRVEPALFAAAEGVKDGELVPHPVVEGKRYAVVWRRGSLKPTTRTLEQEQSAIRQVLEQAQLERELEALTQRLATRYVSAKNTAPLALLPADTAPP